jgi:hypothetical protein
MSEKNIDIEKFINLIEETKKEISHTNEKNKIDLEVYHNLLETIICEYHNCCINIFSSTQ